MPEIYLRDDVAAAWQQCDPFAEAVALRGEVHRAVARRTTLRVEVGGKPYFLKLHQGVGWREIIKNWLSLRAPVLGARNEFEACLHLGRCRISAPAVAAFGETGRSPAGLLSFVLLDEFRNRRSLEEVVDSWQTAPPNPVFKRRLVMAVAEFARQLHGAGVIHRDLYICHFWADVDRLAAGELDLAVLDLHRARIYKRIPARWLTRDLGALLFSVMDAPLDRRAWLRFVRVYRNQPLRKTFADEGAFWQGVYRRAQKLRARGGEDRGLLKTQTRASVMSKGSEHG